MKRWTEKTGATDRRERDEVKSISLHVCKQDDGAEGVMAKGGGGVHCKKKNIYIVYLAPSGPRVCLLGGGGVGVGHLKSERLGE